VEAGYPGSNLRNSALYEWGIAAVKAFLARGTQAYVTLGGLTPDDDHPVEFTEPLRIAIVGDAGFRGWPQNRVLKLIADVHETNPFQALIHLGDIYFSGGADEVLKNFIAPFSPLRHSGIRQFTLCGNHDLYYGAEGYRSALEVLNQPGRYFLLETPHWRIACLDTSLGAERIRRNDAQLDAKQLTWLKRHIKKRDSRPLILMSHHYIISGWEKPIESLAHQLRDITKDRVFAWYWGHEHICATYERGQHGFYGACVGNGAFLEKYSKPKKGELFTDASWFATTKCKCFRRTPNSYWGHGFMELELNQGQLIERYHLEEGEKHERVLSAS
jgi:hypothetical protein